MAYRNRTDVSPDVEIWAQDAEGAYFLRVQHSEGAMRMSDASHLVSIKTVDEAMASPFWPIIKAAMEEEIAGKMKNGAWTVESWFGPPLRSGRRASKVTATRPARRRRRPLLVTVTDLERDTAAN